MNALCLIRVLDLRHLLYLFRELALNSSPTHALRSAPEHIAGGSMGTNDAVMSRVAIQLAAGALLSVRATSCRHVEE